VLATIKSTLSRSEPVRQAYARARSLHDRREASRLFENVEDYLQSLHRKADGRVILRTHDGLQIAIRQNLWDAEIVREIFFKQPYTRRLDLPARPVVVDIGGYIGDFALYAVKYLDARRVVVYEPTQENYAVLRHNIELNGYGDRITAIDQAVGRAGEVVLNVQKLDAGEMHVSSYWYPEAEHRHIACVSLDELLDTHQLDVVDLLKVDCEGGEYDIFPDAPDAAFDRIRNIALEWHEVPGYEAKLERVTNRLVSAGYALSQDRHIISAWRA